MEIALAHQSYGDGPPLILLHGLFGSGRNWTSIAKRLGEAWHVHALDLRNHGDSPWDDDVAYIAMAKDVRAFLDRQQIDRAVVVGHSIGGKTAMALALAHPERVAALVVVDIAPTAYAPKLQAYTRAMLGIDLSGVTRRSEADAELSAAIPEPAIRAFLLQNLVFNDGNTAWRINLAALDAGLPTLSGFPEHLLDLTYDGPTLFLGGGQSDYIRPRHRPTIDRLFPHATLETVDGAGHWVHAEKPREFLAKLEAFLETAAGR